MLNEFSEPMPDHRIKAIFWVAKRLIGRRSHIQIADLDIFIRRRLQHPRPHYVRILRGDELLFQVVWFEDFGVLQVGPITNGDWVANIGDNDDLLFGMAAAWHLRITTAGAVLSGNGSGVEH